MQLFIKDVSKDSIEVVDLDWPQYSFSIQKLVKTEDGVECTWSVERSDQQIPPQEPENESEFLEDHIQKIVEELFHMSRRSQST
jgi:hypothetical protein